MLFGKWLIFRVTRKDSACYQYAQELEELSAAQPSQNSKTHHKELVTKLDITEWSWGTVDKATQSGSMRNPQVVMPARGGLQVCLVHTPVPLAPLSPPVLCSGLFLPGELPVILSCFTLSGPVGKSCHSAIL